MPMSSSPELLPPHPELGRYYRGETGRRSFVRDIFDVSAGDYDRVEAMMALGTGRWYRRRALSRSGLVDGMRVLDVATGTGLVSREAVTITGDARLVTGLDPSMGMLQQARRSLTIPVLLGMGEQLPLRGASIDFLTMGYALRHLSDLLTTFREFFRVLRPGGRVCILEMTPPRRSVPRALLRSYVRWIIPLLARATGRRAETALLWQYFWDTMDRCVPPDAVLRALAETGFESVDRFVEIGLFSEYTGLKPSD